jgi:murein DD-endopeptidase MepM/ murein hydrolase activator NlpD
MAISLAPSRSITNIRSDIKSVQGTFLSFNKQTVKLNTTLMKKTKVKREAISRSNILYQKRTEDARRKNREDILEASSVRGAVNASKTAVAASSKGFLGRIMDFLGTLLVGWLLTNLPTIISMAQELIARMQKLSYILRGFFGNTLELFRGFGRLITDVGNNILSLDFDDTKQKIESSITDLQGTFDEMQSQFEEGFKLLSTPLSEGIASGQNAPPTGTEYPNQTIPPSSAEDYGTGTPGAGGKLAPIHKQALDIISGPESGGDYNAMNNGQAADRPGGAKKWLGKNLTDMTIGEVKNYQNVKKELWAAGRYQIVPGTLPIAQKGAGLKDSDMFDQNNQDLLAIAILKSQGPGAWTKYSRYSKEEIAIMYKAKDTPLGASSSQSQQTTNQRSVPQQSALPPLPPTGTLSGQEYGAPREGTRKHAGVDFDAGPNDTFYSRIGGEVIYAANAGGKYGNVVDVYNKELGVTERIAEGTKNLVKAGQKISPGTPVQQGTHQTGVFHYEIRQGKAGDSGSFEGTLDPMKFLQSTNVSSQRPSPSTPSPAQVEPQGTQERQQVPQQLTQERTGPNVVVLNQNTPQQSPSTGGVVGGAGGMYPVIIDPLNSFIKNKLLLDLAYT